MFNLLNKQGVQSDEGFIVQSINRFVIEYREGSKSISVFVERGVLKNGRAFVSISSDDFKKWNDGFPIEGKGQERILENFKKGMEFLGASVLVD